MAIEVHAICWNEAARLPLFLNHYAAIADKIVIWDHHSTDGSPEIARQCDKVLVNKYGTPGVSSEREYIRIKNNMWKRTKSDWVIACDIDELVVCREYGTSVRDYLASYDGPPILRCAGYDISGRLSDKIEVDEWRGTRSEEYDKPAVFRSSIDNINYEPGAHNSLTTTEKSFGGLMLLHCRYLGGWYDVLKRYRELAVRQCRDDIEAGHASRYHAADGAIVAEYAEAIRQSVPVKQLFSCAS